MNDETNRPPPEDRVQQPDSSSSQTRQDLPATRAWMNRTGARQVNFRRWVVDEEDENGYRRKVAEARIKNGKLLFTGDDTFEPTAEEKAAIETEIQGANLPKSMPATMAHARDKIAALSSEGVCFPFLDQRGENVLFLQWRKNGDKPDLPWSFWNDLQWRMMEPEGPLPLFGIERLSLLNNLRNWDSTLPRGVIIHEGAKAASHVRDMVKDNSVDHPWKHDLRQFVHVGWPGGVHRASAVDWEPIKKLDRMWTIVLACDHDVGGVNVAGKISSILRRPLMAIRFDDHFGDTFDLGDKWPQQDKWWKGRRYVGPTMEDCTFPATWATESVKTEDSDKPVFKIRDEFAKEWLWVEDVDAFVNRRQIDRIRGRKQFNIRVRPFSDAEDTARLMDRNFASQCDALAYRPGAISGVINSQGRRLVNTWRPSSIKAIKGDPRPFLEFMEHLIPEKKDRDYVMRWITTLVARPDIRMRYSILLISIVQGVGKTTLGQDILAPLVGEWNVSYPSEKTILDSTHNTWIAHKRLAVISEIYSGQSRKCYDVLKDIVADSSVDVNPKYIKEYTIECYLHAIASSNSERALHLDDEDRRWLVPGITEDIRNQEYWEGFHQWLKADGLGIIMGWLEELAKKPENLVSTGERAPMTSMREEIIEASRSEGQQLAADLGRLVADLGQQIENRGPTKIVLAVEDVRRWVARMRHIRINDNRLEKSLTLRKVLTKAGGLKEPKSRPGQRRQRYKIAVGTSGHQMSEVVANYIIPAGAPWSDLKEHYEIPENLWPIREEDM